MILTHKIALDPTQKQLLYFRKAAGTSRFVYNWALDEWNGQYEAGQRPSAMKLKKMFNAIYPLFWPWVAEVHRDAHAGPFLDLDNAFKLFFAGTAKHPKFKRKHGKASFAVAPDKFKLSGKHIRFPVIGWIRMREELRFEGRLVGGIRIVEDCGRWYVCISVEDDFTRRRTGDTIVGIDLGIRHLATLSTGEHISNPRPLQKQLKKLRRAQRKLSRRKKGSKNREKQKKKIVARIYRKTRDIRRDALHKLSTRICRENQTVAVEDLAVAEMLKDRRFARPLNDASFGTFRAMDAPSSRWIGTSRAARSAVHAALLRLN